jgi:hypothetical protein
LILTKSSIQVGRLRPIVLSTPFLAPTHSKGHNVKKILIVAAALAASTSATALEHGTVHIKSCDAAAPNDQGQVWDSHVRAFNQHDGVRVVAASGGTLKASGKLSLHCKKGPNSDSCQMKYEDFESVFHLDHNNWSVIFDSASRVYQCGTEAGCATEPTCEEAINSDAAKHHFRGQ